MIVDHKIAGNFTEKCQNPTINLFLAEIEGSRLLIIFHSKNINCVTSLVEFLKQKAQLCLLGFVCFVLMNNAGSAFGQKVFIFPSGEEWPAKEKDCKVEEAFDDRFAAEEQLQECLSTLQAQGYLAASFDSLTFENDSLSFQFFRGQRHEWMALNLETLPPAYRKRLRGLPKSFEGQALRVAQISDLQEQLLRMAEDAGFPFAQTSLQDLSWNESGLSGSLALDLGDQVRIDSVLLEGSAKVSSRFLENYLGIKRGSPYNESLIRDISNRMEELNFLRPIQSPEVEFSGKRAKLRLLAERKNASRFDLLLGILPQGGDGGYELSGEGQIDLINSLGAAEEMGVHYKNFPGKVTELKTYLNYPYLPGLPLGLEFKFNIYKRDTLFSEVDFHLGFDYRMQHNDRLKFFFESKQSNLLGIDSSAFVNRNPALLPANHDVNNNFYGINFIRDRRDYAPNPRRGLRIEVELAIGQKKIPRNNSLLAIEGVLGDGRTVVELYDDLELSQLQLRWNSSISKFWPISRRSTIHTELVAAWMQRVDGENAVYDNERFRIGGNKQLRGFDEESLLADAFALLKLEFRFLLDRNSNFFLFGDFARIRNGSGELEIDQNFNALGFGAGLSFQTKAGIFAFSYGLGAQKGNNFELKSGKVHLGYVNYF